MRCEWAVALAFLAMTQLLAPSAHAGVDPTLAGSRPSLRQAPLKDCTRINGRYGYYANPWCSPAEQRAWDLWDARRHALPAGN
jgi:hypothetical protein